MDFSGAAHATFSLKRSQVPAHQAHVFGVVRLAGRDIYLGKYNSPESREKYDQVIAQWLVSGRTDVGMTVPECDATAPDLTVNQLILAYTTFALSYYLRDGEPTPEVDGQPR